MKSQPFEAGVRYQPKAAVIDLQGEINSFAEKGLLRAYQQAETRDPFTIVLNFTQVTYMNSTGIALIVGLLAQARKNHRRLVVYGLSDHYVEIFNITRLADYLCVFPDESSALALDEVG
jgi:anti-sigma B factor antagonist